MNGRSGRGTKPAPDEDRPVRDGYSATGVSRERGGPSRSRPKRIGDSAYDHAYRLATLTDPFAALKTILAE
ncbi:MULTISPECIES: hypothetical protein [unclassified Streptomyces]|uniref:hypothetical protein n=1 Tax=unclassified Streptomyces TaxID=2593676 RepID=UPI0033A47DD7